MDWCKAHAEFVSFPDCSNTLMDALRENIIDMNLRNVIFSIHWGWHVESVSGDEIWVFCMAVTGPDRFGCKVAMWRRQASARSPSLSRWWFSLGQGLKVPVVRDGWSCQCTSTTLLSTGLPDHSFLWQTSGHFFSPTTEIKMWTESITERRAVTV